MGMTKKAAKTPLTSTLRTLLIVDLLLYLGAILLFARMILHEPSMMAIVLFAILFYIFGLVPGYVLARNYKNTISIGLGSACYSLILLLPAFVVSLFLGFTMP